MLTTNKQRVVEIYDCVKQFHSLETFPQNLPDPQNYYLLPTLRPYQVKAVQWMLMKERYPTYYERLDGNSSKSEDAVLLPKGGILAEEMGLGKTVEVIACILSNPKPSGIKSENVTIPSKMEGKEIKQETVDNEMEIVNKGDELHPTEDGIVEIGSLAKESENFQYGVGSLSDSGFVEGFAMKSESNESCIKVESEQVGTLDRPKRRSRKPKKSASISSDLESDEEYSPSNKRVRFDVPLSSSRKRKRNPVEEVKSSVDITIDDVVTKYCYSGVIPQPKKRREAALKGEKLRKVLQDWYEERLSATTVRQDRAKRSEYESSFQCCCIGNVYSNEIVNCTKCKTWQHCECVGYVKALADYDYYCFQCWVNQPLIHSAGTVIISPEAISQQWVSEIEKHIKKEKHLKLLVYEGVRVNGYIQPHDLASYDIIITTYEVLSKELNYTEPVTRSLRHAKRFFAPTSPLLFIKWWRLCLDEAQMVEGSSCRAAEMAKKFTATNKWAVTGTPIQKAVNDLVGLLEFLAGTEHPEFLAMMRQEWRMLLRLVPRVLWRSQMKDVLAEVGVPPQSVVTHNLDFSKIEQYFYKCTHTECSQQFVNRISRFEDLNIPLKSLDRKLMNTLLNPLLKLRQACLHPQAVRGKFVSFKKTMTMDDLVSQMVTNAKLDSEQALRQLVSTLNGMGALLIICQQWPDAVTAYRTVLHLEQEHSGRLKIDSLQRIHTMHNLAEILDGGYEGIPPTLRDGKLREDIKALEQRYVGKREAPIAVTEARVDSHAGAIAAMLEGSTVGYTDWWLRMLEWSKDRDELLDRLKSAIQHTDVQQKNQYNNLANKLKSLYVVRLELARWLAEMDRVRQEVCQCLRNLRTADTDVMASEALCCHLQQTSVVRNPNRCCICKAETVLKSYEALLFEERMIKRRENKRNLPGSSDWTKDKDLDNREISHLIDVNVNTFQINFKGGFKASPFERILKALAAYGKHNKAPSEWVQEANHHMALLEKIKKEFLDLNLLWRQISDLVDAKDELNMCKMRLRLPHPGEEEKEEKKKTGGNIHIIHQYMVVPELSKLRTEKAQHEAQLKKKIGTLCYLETLQKEGAPTAICPVCRNDLTDKWSVLQCGHCLCLDCLSLIIKPAMVNLQCPQCRQHCSVSEVSYVESQPDTPASAAITTQPEAQNSPATTTNSETQISAGTTTSQSIPQDSAAITSQTDSLDSAASTSQSDVQISTASTSQSDSHDNTASTTQSDVQISAASTSQSESPFSIKGSHSTKVEAILGRTLALTCQEPDVKILIFSAWEKVLDLLAEAFQVNNITFRRVKNSKVQRRQSIKEFKVGDVTVLLLALRSGGKGLNLVEATHVFLVEPILNPADELQAVGRVHRIGQTRPTTVHRFIIRETIEERIVAAVAASGAEQWSDDCVTLQQLFDLFSSDGDLSLTLTQEEGEPTTSVVNVDSDTNSDDEEEDGQQLDALVPSESDEE